MKRIGLCLLLCGMLFHHGSGSGEVVTVVANSIDREWNSDFVNFLKSERDVTLVHPSEFDVYMNSAYIVILGGNKALEGTGEIVDSMLTEEEKSSAAEEGSMVVKLNVWRTGQVVVVLAGREREHTKAVCEETKEKVCSLFDGIDAVVNMITDIDLMVFLWPFPVLSTDVIAPYAGSPLSGGEVPYLVPYSLGEDTWFFWIDDAPHAKYAHPTRFFFYGIESGSQVLYQEEWWPVLNGTSLWVEPEQYWDKTFWMHNPGVTRPRSGAATTRGTALESSVTGSTARALVVNGWSDGQPHQEDMSADEQGMTEALIKTGMRVESVTTVGEIQYVLSRWAQEMKPSDTLVLYITAHGGRGYFSVNNHVVAISELVTLLNNFEKVHIHVIIDVCYSGSLVYPLKSVADTVITSTDEVAPAYGDWDPEEDVNPSDKGSEFTSGLVLCIQELVRNKEKMNEWKTASGTNTSWYSYLLTEAFKTARELDAAAVKGYTNPTMWGKTEIMTEQIPQESEGESGEQNGGGGGCPCGG